MGDVQLHHYQHVWPERFAAEKTKIRRCLGKDYPVEHIGSTAVPGMKAKPVVDLMLGLPHLDIDRFLIDALQKADYTYVPKDEWKERYFFRKGEPGNGTCHLHIVAYEGGEWRDKLAFRDYLKKHPGKAADYQKLKSRPAVNYRKNRSRYTASKEPFIQHILHLAAKES
ncbi:GrpB family protein [Halobacillus halophilus]|uniref:GrpB family protein n=1 Tax=Halobacillus halophilus TaxID=1570 RepID=UPI00136FA43E|nr:GrpB family protein [Halobacillus halophilus]MYL29595.1 GrpB family protein [Halobacillus halophilus]